MAPLGDSTFEGGTGRLEGHGPADPLGGSWTALEGESTVGIVTVHPSPGHFALAWDHAMGRQAADWLDPPWRVLGFTIADFPRTAHVSPSGTLCATVLPSWRCCTHGMGRVPFGGSWSHGVQTELEALFSVSLLDMPLPSPFRFGGVLPLFLNRRGQPSRKMPSTAVFPPPWHTRPTMFRPAGSRSRGLVLPALQALGAW